MSSTGRKITLKSSDGETFEVDEAVALESQTIKHMIEDDCADNGIPLPNVTSKILSKAIEYCQKHVEAPKSDDRATSVDDELKAWDADFVKVNRDSLYYLILAADYLEIKGLIDLTCQAVPGMPKGLTAGDIQKIFNNKNDFDLTMSAKGRKFCLKSDDGYMFMVTEAVALESQTIKHMIEDDCADCVIPLPNVKSKILSKVIEYCKKHVEAPKSDDRATSVDDELKASYADFIKVDKDTFFDLINAANYLNIKSLLDPTCQTVADFIKGKTPEEIKKTLNVKNTPEEEEEARQENQWAFD